MANMTDRCRVAVELSKRQVLRIQRAIGASREQIDRTARVIDDSAQLLAAPDDAQTASRPDLQRRSR